MNRKLLHLAKQRLALFDAYKNVLMYAGPNHPHRSEENKQRAKRRKALRHQLRNNEEQIVFEIMRQYLHRHLP